MNRSVVRLLIFTQLFSLGVLLLMPLLVHWLGGFTGKCIYAALVLISLGFCMALRYALTDTK